MLIRNQIIDALYNCKNPMSKDYARGIIVGLFSGMMANGYTFEHTMQMVKKEVLGGISDLGTEDVVTCLPEGWVKYWREA